MSETLSIPLVYHDTTPAENIELLHRMVATHHLPITLINTPTSKKLTQKYKELLSQQYTAPVLLIDTKNGLMLLSDTMSVSPDWQALQRRIVSAGRKNELILRAAKPNETRNVLDATAGFGHDALILASSGAQVTLLEQNPLMALLLLNEQARMTTQKNWQKLMTRMTVCCADALTFMTELKADKHAPKSFDVVYLDPMFPENSYNNTQTGKGAKVGKQMQALHYIAKPPTLDEERLLLSLAQQVIKDSGRVVVKRPLMAKPLANIPATESWRNDVVRFDGYFSADH